MARPPKSEAERKDETIAVRLPNYVHVELRRVCDSTGVRISDFVRMAIIDTLALEAQS